MKHDIAGIQQQVQSSIRERRFIGNYEIVRKIGEGAFSSVYLAIHIMTRHEVVLKSAEKNQTNLASEIANMSLLYHPHIVRLYEYIVTADQVWLVLEYCGGEELFSYLVRCRIIPPQQACQLFAQLAGAVAYAHQRHCAHRDLKLENVLLDDKGLVKLGDFGFTRSYVPRTMLETVCGTESYMAPELVLRKKYHPEAADVWSLGIILYAMIYGQFPFDDDNAVATNRRVVEEDPPFPPVEGGEALVDLARRILAKDPRRRPTVNQILDELGDQGKQQQSLLLRLEAHPELSHIFTSKEEKNVLKGMKVLNIDLHAVASSVVNHKCDPLHGLWFTALDRQRALRTQDGDGTLRRHRSRASTHSVRSFGGRSVSRVSQKALSRQSSVGWTAPHKTSLISHSTPDIAQESDTENEAVEDAVTSPAKERPRVLTEGDVTAEIEAQSDPNSSTSGTLLSSTSDVARDSSLPDKTNESLKRTEGLMASKSRRALQKLWTAVKWRRNDNKDTLIAYYRPSADTKSTADERSLNAASTLDTTDASFDRLGQPRLTGTSSESSHTLSTSPSALVLNLGARSLKSPSKRLSNISLNSVHSAPQLETPVRRNGQLSSINSNKNGEETASQNTQPLQPSQASLVSQKSGLTLASTTSNGSHISSLSGSPHQLSPALGGSAAFGGISRPMSTYSEMSTLSQISESSVDASQLLSDVQDSPRSLKQSNSVQRWRSFANAGIAKKSGREAVNGNSMSTSPSMRQRVRLLSLKERIPHKIEESEGEGGE